MSKYQLKTGKIGAAVVDAYDKLESGVVGAYKKVENGVVDTYKKIETAFVEKFLVQTEEEQTEEESNPLEK